MGETVTADRNLRCVRSDARKLVVATGSTEKVLSSSCGGSQGSTTVPRSVSSLDPAYFARTAWLLRIHPHGYPPILGRATMHATTTPMVYSRLLSRVKVSSMSDAGGCKCLACRAMVPAQVVVLEATCSTKGSTTPLLDIFELRFLSPLRLLIASEFCQLIICLCQLISLG